MPKIELYATREIVSSSLFSFVAGLSPEENRKAKFSETTGKICRFLRTIQGKTKTDESRCLAKSNSGGEIGGVKVAGRRPFGDKLMVVCAAKVDGSNTNGLFCCNWACKLNNVDNQSGLSNCGCNGCCCC